MKLLYVSIYLHLFPLDLKYCLSNDSLNFSIIQHNTNSTCLICCICAYPESKFEKNFSAHVICYEIDYYIDLVSTGNLSILFQFIGNWLLHSPWFWVWLYFVTLLTLVFSIHLLNLLTTAATNTIKPRLLVFNLHYGNITENIHLSTELMCL